MSALFRLLLAALGAAFFMGSALAQSGTVTNHAFAIGKGPGVQGYKSLLCASAQLAIGQAAADPVCQTITGDVTINASGVTAIGAGKVTNGMIASMTSAQLATILSDETGTGLAYFQGGALGTPLSGTLTNATGLPIGTGVSGLGTGCATFLGAPSSANLRGCLTDEVGTGAAYFVGGALGTPASGTATNLTGLPLTTGVTGTLPIGNGGTGQTTAATARASSGLNVDSFTGHGDSAYSILTTDRTVGTNAAFTASRTWTLPAANAVNPGQEIIVADYQGTVTATNTLVISRAGTDTVNGGTSVTISAANGAYLFKSDGISKWTAQGLGSAIGSGVSSLDGVTGGISVQSGSLKVVGSTLSSNVLSSRAFAATQNLSSFSSIRTLGYASAGDGGGGIFHNIGTSAALQDQGIATLTVTGNGGSGCTTPATPSLSATVTSGNGGPVFIEPTVSGGVVTAAVATGNKGNYFNVGDTLSLTVSGCASTTTYTVATITTVVCSFTDTAGNRWQLIVDKTNTYNVRQCGAVINRGNVSSDASATNDFSAIQATLNLAGASGRNNLTPDSSSGIVGAKVIMPAGTSLLCGSVSLQVPLGVAFVGVNNEASKLKFCDTGFTTTIENIDICDPTWHVACFGARMEDISVYSVDGNTNIPVIFSNNLQQSNMLKRVTITALTRGCVKYSSGFGGASFVGFDQVWCTEVGGVGGSSSIGMWFSGLGTTEISVTNCVVEAGGTTAVGNAALFTDGGYFIIQSMHVENFQNGVQHQITAGSGFMQVMGLSGGVNIINLVYRSGGSANTTYVSDIVPNGATNTLNNNGVFTTGFVGVWTNF
jgi:hypothetical protein